MSLCRRLSLGTLFTPLLVWLLGRCLDFDEEDDALCNYSAANGVIVLQLLVRDSLRPGDALGRIHGRRGEGARPS